MPEQTLREATKKLVGVFQGGAETASIAKSGNSKTKKKGVKKATGEREREGDQLASQEYGKGKANNSGEGPL